MHKKHLAECLAHNKCREEKVTAETWPTVLALLLIGWVCLDKTLNLSRFSDHLVLVRTVLGT